LPHHDFNIKSYFIISFNKAVVHPCGIGLWKFSTI